jgi:hypothetical protein
VLTIDGDDFKIEFAGADLGGDEIVEPLTIKSITATFEVEFKPTIEVVLNFEPIPDDGGVYPVVRREGLDLTGIPREILDGPVIVRAITDTNEGVFRVSIDQKAIENARRIFGL